MNNIYSDMWRILPSFMFNPEEGDQTLEGIALSNQPSLSEDEKIKFAVFTDSRFYMPYLFEKLIPFLPEEFKIVDEPNGQNCFMYSLNIKTRRKKFGAKDFDLELERRGYQYQDFSITQLIEGDIIVYSIHRFIHSIRTHAGIYVGNGRIQSRWGQNSPLIEHPIKEVVPNYWNKDERYLTIERMKG
jgi:hypothetical protein